MLMNIVFYIEYNGWWLEEHIKLKTGVQCGDHVKQHSMKAENVIYFKLLRGKKKLILPVFVTVLYLKLDYT